MMETRLEDRSMKDKDTRARTDIRKRKKRKKEKKKDVRDAIVAHIAFNTQRKHVETEKKKRKQKDHNIANTQHTHTHTRTHKGLACNMISLLRRRK